MQKRLLLMFSMLLASCVTVQPPPPPPPTAPSTSPSLQTVVDGPATAAALTARYNDTQQNCRGSASMPAFLCSGVILRVTTFSTAYDAWDPSPTAIAKKGVSFSYLRQDSKFQRMPWNGTNGFILYPIFAAPPDKIDPDVLCNYPIDGWSDNRDERCGTYPNFPTSRSCELQNITTYTQWVTLFTQQGKVNSRLCAFNVRDNRNQLAGPAFYASLRAKSDGAPGDVRFTQHNELVLAPWKAGQARVLPLQAFFYTTSAGLADAKRNRASFLIKAGISLPLIKITLPQTTAQNARFEYIPADNT
ncbi:hypothetical protein [Pseudomonas fluorescens]|uniref:hypothetical protein n=1 Tax=Pseudomonas fluorescens TaxID=294 RepID=UPI00177D94B5|nr:hypothetical protein [Pseudomonas fluorescens]